MVNTITRKSKLIINYKQNKNPQALNYLRTLAGPRLISTLPLPLLPIPIVPRPLQPQETSPPTRAYDATLVSRASSTHGAREHSSPQERDSAAAREPAAVAGPPAAPRSKSTSMRPLKKSSSAAIMGREPAEVNSKSGSEQMRSWVGAEGAGSTTKSLEKEIRGWGSDEGLNMLMHAVVGL
ncbi:uncharacterized protein A4U43_C08F24950 [Asparagus officinalis]|nr:uncharacterized protein A4U43_C08F24950 [Asparagus officinalis]